MVNLSMCNEKVFNKMGLDARVDVLREQGTYIGARYYGSYHVHLYALNGFYVELYMKLGINLIQIVEIQKNRKIIEQYAEGVKLEIDLS